MRLTSRKMGRKFEVRIMETYSVSYASSHYAEVQSIAAEERPPEQPERPPDTVEAVPLAPYPDYMGDNVDILI